MYVHCNECHHEWECTSKDELCDWCGGGFYILEPTPTRTSIIDVYLKLKKLKNTYADKIIEKIKKHE